MFWNFIASLILIAAVFIWHHIRLSALERVEERRKFWKQIKQWKKDGIEEFKKTGNDTWLLRLERTRREDPEEYVLICSVIEEYEHTKLKEKNL